MIFAHATIDLNPGKTLWLVPFGDIQSEEEYPRLEGLAGWLDARKQTGDRVAMWGMGDYFEAPSPSDRAAMNAAKNGFGHYDDLCKTIMEAYESRALSLAKRLGLVQDDILGLLKGHHWMTFNSTLRPDLPTDTNQLLCDKWGCDYWGDTVQLEINIREAGRKDDAPMLPFRILASHGYGSARTPGARITKRIRMREVVMNCHWYCMGHDNEKSVYVTESLIGREYFKQYYSGTGSFQRAYNFDNPEGSYAEKLLLPPTSLGVVMGMVKLQKAEDGTQRLDYHVST